MMLNMKIPEGKHIGRPARNDVRHVTTYTQDLLDLSLGNSSRIAATVGSTIPTMEDMASRVSMRKKRKLKRGGAGIRVMASG